MRTDEPKVVLVTGAGGGIGGAVARRFTEGGWRVAVTDHDRDALARIASEVSAASAVQADLRQVSACASVVDDVVSACGRLDGLVNAAGLWTEGPAELTTEDDWDRVFGVNVKGLFFMTAAAVPHLAETSGFVTNMSSDAGLQGNTGAAVYCASKGAVSNLTRALALELAPRAVRVNAVCPGDVDTPMIRYQAETFGKGDPEAYLRDLLALYPQGPASRFIRADEIAELIWFLGQPAAAPITGANLSIDFGLSAGV